MNMLQGPVVRYVIGNTLPRGILPMNMAYGTLRGMAYGTPRYVIV